MIYLDHASTTPVHEQVSMKMIELEQEAFANPSSSHFFGRKAQFYLNEARHIIAESIHAKEQEILFTSGGTEANNLAIIGAALAHRSKGNHLITSEIEHHSILQSMDYLETLGFSISYVPVDEQGVVWPGELERALTDETILVTLMAVNNETGMIQPIDEISQIVDAHGALFHTDAVQAYGLLDIDVKELPIDLLTASAHKINGPKGSGFLYVKENTSLEQRQFGGNQERILRPGTENVSGIAGFSEAIKMLMSKKSEIVFKLHAFKELFLEELSNHRIRYHINGNVDLSSPAIVNISFPGMDVESLLTNLDLAGIAASGGSACSAGSLETSHVLEAMYGKSSNRLTNSIRFSFGSLNTEENISEAVKRIAAIVLR